MCFTHHSIESPFHHYPYQDLPFIEGTPLEHQNDTSLNWSILDYQEDENGYIWVWLQYESQQAYLVYPSSTTSETFTFPNGETISIDPKRVNLTFIGAQEQQIDITRIGGKITLAGEQVRISYTPIDITNITNAGNDYYLNSNQEMDVSFGVLSPSEGSTNINGDLSVTASEGIVAIEGTEGIDTIHANSIDDNKWTITAPNSGNITMGNSLSLINFVSMESFYGGLGSDTFNFSESEDWVPPSNQNSCSSTTLSSVTISNGQNLLYSPADTICVTESPVFSIDALNLSSVSISSVELSSESNNNVPTTAQPKKKSRAGATSKSFMLLMLSLILFSRLWRGLLLRHPNSKKQLKTRDCAYAKINC